MGSSTSGILHILLMDKLDNIPLSSQQLISPYKRYVNEIFLQITEAGAAKEFHKWTAYTYDYKFEIEKPTKSVDGVSLSLSPKTGTVPSIFTKAKRSIRSYTINQSYEDTIRSTSSATNADVYNKVALPKQHFKTATAHEIKSFASTDTMKIK